MFCVLFCVLFFYILTFFKFVFVLVHLSTVKASVAAERRRKMGMRRKKAQEEVVSCPTRLSSISTS